MLKGLLLAMVLVFAPQSFAVDCIKIEEQLYCVKTEPKIGNVPIKITDPRALLRAAGASKGGLKKVGLYDDYHKIPIIVELARQQGMGYDQFVYYMAHNWDQEGFNPFRALIQLELLYEQVPPEFRDALVESIVTQVIQDVLKTIETYQLS